MYLLDYIAYGLHLCYKITTFKEISREPIFLHPCLATSLPKTQIRPPKRMLMLLDFGPENLQFPCIRISPSRFFSNFGGGWIFFCLPCHGLPWHGHAMPERGFPRACHGMPRLIWFIIQRVSGPASSVFETVRACQLGGALRDF